MPHTPLGSPLYKRGCLLSGVVSWLTDVKLKKPCRVDWRTDCMKTKRKPPPAMQQAQKFIAFAQERKAGEIRIRNHVSQEPRGESLVKNQTACPWTGDVRCARGKIGKRVAIEANCARRRSSDFGEQAIAPRARRPSNEAPKLRCRALEQTIKLGNECPRA